MSIQVDVDTHRSKQTKKIMNLQLSLDDIYDSSKPLKRVRHKLGLKTHRHRYETSKHGYERSIVDGLLD